MSLPETTERGRGADRNAHQEDRPERTGLGHAAGARLQAADHGDGGRGDLLLLVGIVAYAVYTYMSVSSKLAPKQEERERIEQALDEPVLPPPGTKSPEFSYELLLGNDSLDGESQARTDTIVLAGSPSKTTLLCCSRYPETRARRCRGTA